MKFAPALTLLMAALVLHLASHLHDELVDHKTGKAWELNGQLRIPVMIAPCPNPPSFSLALCEGYQEVRIRDLHEVTAQAASSRGMGIAAAGGTSVVHAEV